MMKLLNSEAVIEVEDLRLEPILPEHASILFEKLQDENLYTYIPVNPPRTKFELETKYLRWSKRAPDDFSEVWLNYAIFDLSKQEYVGTLQATIFSPTESYIAYEIFPKFWRQGLAKSACRGLLQYLFDVYKIDDVIAHIDTRNFSSIKLVKSLHFKKSSFIKDADEFKGSKSDEFVFKLSSNEFFEENLSTEISIKT